MSSDLIAVIVLSIIAVAFVAWRIYRACKGGSCGCSSCCCGKKPEAPAGDKPGVEKK